MNCIFHRLFGEWLSFVRGRASECDARTARVKARRFGVSLVAVACLYLASGCGKPDYEHVTYDRPFVGEVHVVKSDQDRPAIPGEAPATLSYPAPVAGRAQLRLEGRFTGDDELDHQRPIMAELLRYHSDGRPVTAQSGIGKSKRLDDGTIAYSVEFRAPPTAGRYELVVTHSGPKGTRVVGTGEITVEK